MAGRKHHLQAMGMMPPGINHEDPIERDMAFRSMQATPYCKHCGLVILNASEGESGARVDTKWEMQNQAHYRCYMNWQKEKEEELRAIERKRAEEAANFDWEKYMEEMMGKRGDSGGADD